ncbi:MAG: 50S ribosomal protein L11 methyltransferase [Planctomycetes bacterium]|nr:50S ribosomal protein L11 methyltransferase [Planctomycetota bacterium]
MEDPSDAAAVPWIEVSLTVDAGWAERVAEVLGHAPCSPVAIEPPDAHGRCTLRAWIDGAHDDDALRAGLRARLAALARALDPSTNDPSRAHDEIQKGRSHRACDARDGSPAGAASDARRGATLTDDLVPRFTVPDARARATFAGLPWRSFRVGRLCIGAPGALHTRRVDDVALRLVPGNAFGTGRHPTTRQGLRALQEHLRPGARVLDLGCGTGLLGVAAALLGAAQVTLLDHDPLAIAAARELADAHDVSSRCTFVTGSAADVPAGPWGVILANLEPGLAAAHAPRFARVLAPGGVLVAGGCPRADADLLRDALRVAGLVPERLRATPRWCTWSARRP